ncbi:TRAP transporter substrate-binding protein DctP [Pseudoalteromonas sp. OOF1S-7]|uniref:TRAP transporter substrate-binding protein n=1 Tax=Pseudoalteromonas sp. OOF1S-7 TaxID=2917757 RepID=UPI001EF459AC|nr:TRAP transporter substrate-binding protein DctP [Pseudoalteromonas sp. OOF1S-7]MCG7533428.1 TRAP transporter substrate-binding protein DctP [Pseudoalteromonas sp. OOF1S-7]
MASNKNDLGKHSVSRRDFFALAGRFGLSSVFLAWSDLLAAGEAISEKSLQITTGSVYNKRFKKKAKFNLRFGAAHFTRPGLSIIPNGSLPFVADLEERTDGEIRVEYIGGNQLCREVACATACINGTLDFFSASTQNASTAAPYFNILDFPYLWPSRAALYYFFYHPQSEVLLRAPLRKYHNLEFLFSHAELRGFMLGLKYKNKPKVMNLKALQGAKIRVTGTQLGRISMKLMGVQPVPVPWSDTLKALEVGALDGAETWSSAVPYGNWGNVISQDVQCQFMAGCAMTSMNRTRFEQLGSDLQQAVRESAYLTQRDIQKSSECKLVTVTGITEPPLPGSYYHQHSIRNAIWTPEERLRTEQSIAPKFNPAPWVKWRLRLDRMANNLDIYGELYQLARQIPLAQNATDLEARRYWKG